MKTLFACLALLVVRPAWAQSAGAEFPEQRGVESSPAPAYEPPPQPPPPPPTVEAPPADAQPAPPPKKSLATVVGESTPEDLVNRVMPGGFKILFHGYFRAPLRITFNDRGASQAPGDAQYNIRTPWLVDDDYFRSGFAYTRLQEQDWAELYLGVGNKWLTGEIALMGSLYSDWARPLIDHQFGISQGYLTFHWDKETPRVRFKLQVRGGAFWDRWGYLEEYDTYLFGRTHQLGGQTRGEWSTRRFTFWLLQGVGAHLDAIDANQGLTILNYAGAGFRYKNIFETGFYFNDQLEQDKRQLKEIKDADMRVYGLEAKLHLARLGHFYVGGSIITTSNATYLSPALEVVHAYGGRGITENYLGTDKSENGTGRLYNLAFEHRYSLAELLRSAGPSRLRALHGGDLQLTWFGLATYVLSKQADPDPTINKNGRTYFKWGVMMAYNALSWLGISLRYDRVTLDSNDDANGFRILTPRITLRTHWLVDGEIYVQYSRYFYGGRVALRPGQIPLETVPDSDVFKIQAQLLW
jgi:hypothetical protein